jgi:Protein of unknown function (DUF2523)
MPLILALIGALVRAVGPIVAQVMISLGFSFVTYTGIDFAITEAKARAMSALSSNGQLFMQFMGVFQVGTAINIIASAFIARTVLQGIVGGKITKLVTKA